MTSMWKPAAISVLACTFLLGRPGLAAAPDDKAPATPTFTKDVARIFQAKCESCHRPDSIAPMSLVTYEESRPWARSIKNRVAARQMPPWHIDETIGIQEFKNDRSLSDEEIETIVRWVDAGAPKGDAKDMPPPVEWPSEQGWNFAKLFGQSEPDLIIKSTPWTQKAGANDAWWKPVVETGLTEARWVRAIEIRPSTVKGRKITHHAIARLQQEETDRLRGQRRRPRRQPAARHVHGMGRRQAGRDDAAEQRQADAAGLEDRLGHPLLERRRGHHRPGRAGHLLLSEGPGAEVPPGAAPDGRDQRRRRGHSAEHGQGHRGLLRDARERRASRASSRTCTCAARRCRWRRSCRTAARTC